MASSSLTNNSRAGDQSARRLAESTNWWRQFDSLKNQPSAANVFRIAMTYITRFDPKGRGQSEEESLFGFLRLTWGDRAAEITPDMRANDFVCSSPPPCCLKRCNFLSFTKTTFSSTMVAPLSIIPRDNPFPCLFWATTDPPPTTGLRPRLASRV